MSEPVPPDTASDEASADHLRRRIAELENAVAARDELISLIGHELRNPLSPVFLQAHHMMAEVQKAAGGQMAADWLAPRFELFLRGIDRLLDRLNRVMDVASLQAPGDIALEEEDVDLSGVVGDLVSSLARQAAAASATFDLSAPVPMVGHWDRIRLEQIAGNLLSNAIRYGGGRIEVEVHELSPGVAGLVVRDQGPGIAADVLPRLFDRFDRAGQRGRGGLGLGLWIVHRLCTAMGGQVTVRSDPGHGACFVVALPRGSPATDPDEV